MGIENIDMIARKIPKPKSVIFGHDLLTVGIEPIPHEEKVFGDLLRLLNHWHEVNPNINREAMMHFLKKESGLNPRIIIDEIKRKIN